MRTGQKEPFTRACTAIISFAAALGGLLTVGYIGLREQCESVCSYKAKQAASEIISQAARKCLEQDGGNYLKLTYDENGKVRSAQADTVRINQIEDELRHEINNALSDIENRDIGVHIGTLTGLSFLNERGHTVRMILQAEGAAEVKLEGKLESAGINQTRHTLSVKVETELAVFLPWYEEEVEVGGDYVISETLIVGEVPIGLAEG